MIRIILTGSQKESGKAIPADVLILRTILILVLRVKVQGLVPIRATDRVPGTGQRRVGPIDVDGEQSVIINLHFLSLPFPSAFVK